MNKTLTLFAAAATLVIANTSLAPVAEAGGGVRLQFGFPLGSFVARPCGSCGSSSHSHRSHYAAKKAAKIRAAKAAARRQAIAEARAEKLAERRAAIAEAKAEARRERLAEARRLARLKKQREAAEEDEVAALDTKAPDTTPLPVRPAEEVADVSVGEPKVILSNGKQAEEKAEQEDKVAIAPVPAKKVEAPRPTDCKKFVPSAGLTITVPCQ